MRPEQAAAKAAEILDEARESYVITEAASSLVGIAGGWTRPYEALSSAPNSEQPAVTTEVLTKIRDVHEIQGRDGNWDMDDYMRGMYNGLELALSMLEGERKPRYRSPVPGAPTKMSSSAAAEETAELALTAMHAAELNDA